VKLTSLPLLMSCDVLNNPERLSRGCQYRGSPAGANIGKNPVCSSTALNTSFLIHIYREVSPWGRSPPFKIAKTSPPMRHNGPSVEKSVRVAAQTRINVRVKFLRSENRHRRRQRGDISKPINFGHVNAVRNPLRKKF
jgi:hypothetical protein